MMYESWSFLANYARVLLCLAHDPGTRLRDIGASLDITDRSAYGIITDLTAAGYVVKHKDGRRNRYQIQARLPLPEPASQEPAIGEVLALLVGERLGRVPDGAERTRQPEPRQREPGSPAAAADNGSTDLRRVTAPLGISDRNTIWLFLVDRAGQVRWRGSGSWDPATAASLAAALAGLPEHASAAEPAAGPGAGQFEMAFDPRFRLPLATLGVTPATAHVTVTADCLVACFGPWTCRTTPANVRAVNVTGPYRWSRAIGPRLSLADHGLTFGTTPARGLPPATRTRARHRSARRDPPPRPDPDRGRPRAIRCHRAPLRGPARPPGRRTLMSTPSARRLRPAWSPRRPDTWRPLGTRTPRGRVRRPLHRAPVCPAVGRTGF